MPVVSEVAVGYRVEVSGWDTNQDFFVEKAELEWSEGAGKLVLLKRAVAPGALVFLRLLDPTSPDRVHPVPYRAEPVSESVNGSYRVRLLPARPQATG